MNDECYVYIVLPGETEFVTAGKFVLSTDRHGVATGRFIYGRSYRARENAVPIDPLRFLLDRAEAESMIDDMERTVLSRWYDIARAEGVSDQDCDRISSAFAYPGFRLEPFLMQPE